MGDGRQYTITILPSFMQPYSRFSVESIVKATDSYFNGLASCYQIAAFQMDAESNRTFYNYLKRIQDRCDQWCLMISMWIALLYGKNKWERKPPTINNELKIKWALFGYLTNKYCEESEKINQCQRQVLYGALRYQYIFGLLSLNRLGLGP